MKKSQERFVKQHVNHVKLWQLYVEYYAVYISFQQYKIYIKIMLSTTMHLKFFLEKKE